MKFFDYDPASDKAEYFETLQGLMERWEYEIIEFKSATGQYSPEKIGKYFSAISCEANLKQQQYGWFVLGVSETETKHVVGTAFKQGDPMLLEQFKYEISQDTTDGITFMAIVELYPVVNGEKKRVLMFQIPAAVVGIPTGWKNQYYARAGESLVALPQFKIDQIRRETRRDWSKLILSGATIQHLDKAAIALARDKYKEKMNRAHITEEINALDDEAFLTKIKLIIDGKVTNAGMILLGNPEYDYLFPSAPEIMWRLYSVSGELRDYEIFKIPFINVVDQVFAKVRNLVYRYMPNQLSLFPIETQQYDTWLLRELLNNCIAHSNYQLGGRIYINEFDDKIIISNPGDFIPQSIEAVLKPTYNPPFHRNQLLAEAMVSFHMIDTATSGIKKVFRIQRNKFFPMPDYDLTQVNQVAVTVYGKVINEKYTYILFDHPDLDLETVYLLDKVQKGEEATLSKDAIQYLRKHHLIEGRSGSLFLSAEVARNLSEEAEYIKNKGFDDQYYKDLIISFIRQYSSASKKQIRNLLWDKLPDVLTDQQKESKVHNLMMAMRKKGTIKPNSVNHQKNRWILGDDADQ